MDIENITGREIEGKLINVLDYEIRYDKNGSANWVKLIVSYHNKKDDKIMVKEFHGNMTGLYDYLVLIEKKMKKQRMQLMNQQRKKKPERRKNAREETLLQKRSANRKRIFLIQILIWIRNLLMHRFLRKKTNKTGSY